MKCSECLCPPHPFLSPPWSFLLCSLDVARVHSDGTNGWHACWLPQGGGTAITDDCVLSRVWHLRHRTLLPSLLRALHPYHPLLSSYLGCLGCFSYSVIVTIPQHSCPCKLFSPLTNQITCRHSANSVMGMTLIWSGSFDVLKDPCIFQEKIIQLTVLYEKFLLFVKQAGF